MVGSSTPREMRFREHRPRAYRLLRCVLFDVAEPVDTVIRPLWNNRLWNNRLCLDSHHLLEGRGRRPARTAWSPSAEGRANGVDHRLP